MRLRWVYYSENNITTFSNDTNVARSLSNSWTSCFLSRRLYWRLTGVAWYSGKCQSWLCLCGTGRSRRRFYQSAKDLATRATSTTTRKSHFASHRRRNVPRNLQSSRRSPWLWRHCVPLCTELLTVVVTSASTWLLRHVTTWRHAELINCSCIC